MDVKVTSSGKTIIEPEIRMETESATTRPLFEAKNNPTITGSKKASANPSSLSWLAKEENAGRKFFSRKPVWANVRFTFSMEITPRMIPIRTPYEINVYIFCLFDIFDLKTKNNDMGKNAKVSVFVGIDTRNDKAENCHFLYTRYNEKR